MSEEISVSEPAEPGQTTPLSRRGLMKNTAVAGAGAASVLVLGAAGSAAADQPQGGPITAPSVAGTAGRDDQQVVVHLRNAMTGAADIFHGDQHTEVVDRGLAEAIMRNLR
ncbi:hypothetical protein OHB13_30920 [Streptomyces sp. NBC_00440]|uniref:hypothetical protein n=2 Tax=unclassified Streptomyces TaxID=2593676 RepID=UPI002E1E4384